VGVIIDIKSEKKGGFTVISRIVISHSETMRNIDDSEKERDAGQRSR
jgi:hypothetical protein